MADIQSPIYEKGKTYKATYITSEGTEKETEFTPNKNINKVGVIRGLNKKAKDFFKLIKITENKKKEENKMKKVTESAEGLMRMIWGRDSSLDNMSEEEITNLAKLDNAIGECEDKEEYGKIAGVIDTVGAEIGLTEEEISGLKNTYDKIYGLDKDEYMDYDEELIEDEDYFEISVVDGDTEGIVSLSKDGGKWYERVIDGDLDKSKFHKTYQSYLKKQDILQWFKQDFDSAVLNESKEVVTEAKSSISKLKAELEKVVKSFMTKPEVGFDENDVEDYSTVVVTWDKENVIAEIRAELTFETISDLADEVNKVVTKYDKDAYFDNVDSGIIRAIIDNSNKNILEEDIEEEPMGVKEADIAKLTGFDNEAENVNTFVDNLEDALAGKGYQTFIDKLDDIVNIGIKKDGKETLVSVYSMSDNYGFEVETVGIGGDFDVEPIYRKGWDAETATPKGQGVIGEPVYAMFKSFFETSVPEVLEIIDEAFAAQDGLTESIDSVHTEYAITYDDMSMEDEYFEDKDDADARFNELKRNGKLNKVYQYYKKNWEFNEDTADYDEGDVEVYYTKGDSLEECNIPQKVEEGYLHLTFTDGSNPYVKYVDTIEEVDEEIAKWEKDFKVTVIKEDGNKIYAKAEPKYKPSNLFDFDDEELEEK